MIAYPVRIASLAIGILIGYFLPIWLVWVIFISIWIGVIWNMNHPSHYESCDARLAAFMCWEVVVEISNGLFWGQILLAAIYIWGII